VWTTSTSGSAIQTTKRYAKDLTEKEWGWENVPVDNWYLYKTRKEAELACLIKLIEYKKT